MGNTTKDVMPKQGNNEKTEQAKPKTPDKIQAENKKEQDKLAAKAPKKAEKRPEESKKEPTKKEKNWSVGFGTTSARGESMSSTTTGLKFENKKKTAEITVGVTTIEEQKRPGAFPTDTTRPGVSVKINF